MTPYDISKPFEEGSYTTDDLHILKIPPCIKYRANIYTSIIIIKKICFLVTS